MGKRRQRVKSESVSGAGEVSEVDLLDVDEGEEVFEHEGMVGFGMITGDPDVFVLLPDKLLLLPLDSPYWLVNQLSSVSSSTSSQLARAW